MKLAPARLAPVFVPRIWGARNLAPLFDAPPSAEPIGEVWLTGERCEFASGPLTGQTLGQAWPTLPMEWTGTRMQGSPRIPLLVKFLCPEDKLSLQVHPDDAYAREHQSGIGKTEMWYVISAQEGAELRAGLAPGVTRESFVRAIGDGTVERCLKRFAVRTGDTFFVPAGTVHAIGPGMVLCEIQQHSDSTYRIFDYDRVQADGTARPLHVQQALEVIAFSSQSDARIEPLQMRIGPLTETFLPACRYFAAEHWEFSERVTTETFREQFELLILLAGRGRMEWGMGAAAYERAQVWFLPAALGAYQLTPESKTELLRAYVLDLETFAQRLASRQVEPSALSHLLHP